jgi:hypothetical protein
MNARIRRRRAGRRCRHRHRAPAGEELWRLHHEGKVVSCELRDDSHVGAGWKILPRHDDEITIGRRCLGETVVRYYAKT